MFFYFIENNIHFIDYIINKNQRMNQAEKGPGYSISK